MPPGLSSGQGGFQTGDAAQFQVVGQTWGVPHSPGYPIWTILANLFVRVVGVVAPDTDPSWRVTVFSTILGLLVLAMVWLTLREMGVDRLFGLLGAGLLAFSQTFWLVAVIAEVYTGNALIFILAIWFTLRWQRTGDKHLIPLLGLTLGAGLAHHRTAIFLLPAVMVTISLAREKGSTTLLRLVKLVLWMCLPLLTYLYLPLTAAGRQDQTWLYTDTSQWAWFQWVVTARDWMGVFVLPSWSELIPALRQLLLLEAREITLPGLMVGLLGLSLWIRDGWPDGRQGGMRLALLGFPLTGLIILGLAYRAADIHTMLTPLTMLLVMGICLCLQWLVSRLPVGQQSLRRYFDPTLKLAMAASVVVLAINNLPQVDQSKDTAAVDLLEEYQAIAETDRIAAVAGGHNTERAIWTLAALNGAGRVSSYVLPDHTTDRQKLLSALEGGQGRVFVTNTDLYRRFPWLGEEPDRWRIMTVPTEHPDLLELLLRPFPSTLPQREDIHLLADPVKMGLKGEIELLAYRQRVVRAEGMRKALRVTLFWRAGDRPRFDYNIKVVLQGGNMQPVQADHAHLLHNALRFSHLLPREIVPDEVSIPLAQEEIEPDAILKVGLYLVLADGVFWSLGETPPLPVASEVES
ncbi:MAG: protein O-mannosyl-transferase family [Anaerolineae bacterium]